jgi:hypothetical protein
MQHAMENQWVTVSTQHEPNGAPEGYSDEKAVV